MTAMNTPDPTDPVIAATLAVDAAQREYDAALTGGVGLPPHVCRALAVRLAKARSELRIAIHSGDDRIDETEVLTRMLPALQPGESA